MQDGLMEILYTPDTLNTSIKIVEIFEAFLRLKTNCLSLKAPLLLIDVVCASSKLPDKGGYQEPITRSIPLPY